MDKGEGSNGSVSYDEDDLARVAALLDQASREPSGYRRLMSARSLFFNPGSDADAAAPVSEGTDARDHNHAEDDDCSSTHDRVTNRLPLLEGAAWAAVNYHVELTVDGKRERARLEPNFKGPDASDPIDTDGQDEVIVAAWTSLAAIVEAPAARALLSHLAFQVGVPEARHHAQAAATAYLEVADTDTRAADRTHSARVAVRLARAVGDNELYDRAVCALEEAAEHALTGERKSVSAAKEGLGTLIREQSPRARELIERACSTWGTHQVGQVFWHLKLQTAADPQDREQIWRDRLAAATEAAESSDSNILKASRFRDVLALAEASGVPELREKAAVLVQSIRGMDLGMMRIHASTHMFDEQFEEVIALVLADRGAGDFLIEPGTDLLESPDMEESPRPPTWYLRLRAFAQHGPPTGNPDDNRRHIENQHRLAPLQRLFPVHLQTPEGLPLYAPETDADRFDLDMVKWETQLLQQWAPIYAEALHRVIDPEIPPFTPLVEVLSEGDEPSNIGHQLAESFFRYWSGDGQAATYTAVPMIEALVRQSVLSADRGIYRLQQKQTPGQYPGLGVLLDLFYEVHDVNEDDQRFFNAALRHPGGWNLRNLLSHGYLPGISGSAAAAVALYAALRVLVLSSRSTSAIDTDGLDEDDDASPSCADGG